MLNDKLNDKKIILASASPRRQQFLKEMNINFSIKIKNIEEVYPKNLKSEEITNYLAKLKANAFEKDLKKNEILITADTIVWHKNKPLEKPQDKKSAIRMLLSLSGKTHKVITSVCIKSQKKEIIFNDVTKVTFAKINEDEINYYVSNYSVLDKAGSYGIQDWIGLIGIKKIKGSYTNVVGLPTQLLYKNLIKFI